MTPNPLVGTWRLVSWENRSTDGTVSHPLGRDAVGLIIYTDDGYMSVAMMRADREPFAADDLLGGTPDEQARAAAGEADARGGQTAAAIPGSGRSGGPT